MIRRLLGRWRWGGGDGHGELSWVASGPFSISLGLDALSDLVGWCSLRPWNVQFVVLQIGMQQRASCLARDG